MAERKSFFKERSIAEIRHLNPKLVYTQRGLLRKILDLASNQALQLMFPIVPAEFRRNIKSSAEASRKCYKHGDYIRLSMPKTQQEAYRSKATPLEIRARDFDALREKREEEVNFVGYDWYSVQGLDRRKRCVPFSWILEGARLFAYAENLAGGIKIQPYADSEKVAVEGAEIVCSVPSREKKKPRYKLKIMHVPIEINSQGVAIASSLVSDFEVSPENRTFDIRYNWLDDREGSSRFVFYPQDIAAYLAILRRFTREHKMAPLVFSPIALPSRKEAELYKRLGNNLIIYDPTLSTKDKLRKPHVAEKSILIGRSICVLGHDKTMYWNPERDGSVSDYNWKTN